MKKLMAICFFLIFALGSTLTVSASFPGYSEKDNRENKATMHITQTAPADYHSELYLKSTVHSNTGLPGSYVYGSIQDYGTRWNPADQGFHLQAFSSTLTYSKDHKSVTLEVQGAPRNNEGLTRTVLIRSTHTFRADNALE